MKTVYANENGEWSESGVVEWTGDRYSVSTTNDAVKNIVERVNKSRSWDTAPPPDHKDAPVSERDEDMGEKRASSLLRTLLLTNGFGLAKESELNGEPL